MLGKFGLRPVLLGEPAPPRAKTELPSEISVSTCQHRSIPSLSVFTQEMRRRVLSPRGINRSILPSPRPRDSSGSLSQLTTAASVKHCCWRKSKTTEELELTQCCTFRPNLIPRAGTGTGKRPPKTASSSKELTTEKLVKFYKKVKLYQRRGTAGDDNELNSRSARRPREILTIKVDMESLSRAAAKQIKRKNTVPIGDKERPRAGKKPATGPKRRVTSSTQVSPVGVRRGSLW